MVATVKTELVELFAPPALVVALVAEIQASHSCGVVQVILVPELLTSGKGGAPGHARCECGSYTEAITENTYTRPVLHGGKTVNLPFAHCANAPLTQAPLPSEHVAFAERVSNLVLENIHEQGR